MEKYNNTSDNNRKQIIKNLQDLAAEVLKLKNEHRQRRPIIIEFSGSPKAGKTSCINSLELFLKRNDFSVKIIQERASVCPVSDKQSPMFNLWTACMSLAGMIGTLEDNKQNIDVLILDRGIFDVLCWFQWLANSQKMELIQQTCAENFFLMDEIAKSIDIVFVFCADPHVSIEREYAHLLTDKNGSIMNETVLNEYLKAIEIAIKKYNSYFHQIIKIDTSNKNQDDVGKEVTETTLNNLKNLLMERVGYVVKSDELMKILQTKNIFTHLEVGNLLQDLKYELRSDVESNDKFIQPIPIAVITNMDENKVLIVKKSNNAVTPDSPEKDKLLPYVGGHSRIEDQTEANSHDFLSICKTTLKREIKEEIGISVAIEDIEPIYIYTQNDEKSKNHVAVCFYIKINENIVKFRINNQEIVANKGKTNSGHLININEIQLEKLESWGRLILKTFFKVQIPLNEDNQLSLFDRKN